MKVRLSVTAGPHQGQAFEFDRHDTLLVGRGEQAALRLSGDNYFSRNHFLVEFNPPRCFLTDLDSRNGTFVNNTRVKEKDLRHGDVISGGKTTIQVQVFNDMGEPATPIVRPMEQTLEQPPAGPQGVPGYDIHDVLGHGGMGVVYLARHITTGQDVALKLLAPMDDSNDNAKTLFLREAQVLSQLNHPRIVRFVELGQVEGRFFFAMEYVPSWPLADVLKPMTPPLRIMASCKIARQVLDALAHAHGLGLVHRDIKPSNILLNTTEGKLAAKLTDFGLAKSYEDAGLSGITRSGDIRGTFAFMPPEQLTCCRDVKPSADIYALGATLYVMLADTTPHDFSQKTRNPVIVVLESEPIPLTARCPWVPAELAAVVHQAMARDPEDRFPSAEAMREALAPFAKG